MDTPHTEELTIVLRGPLADLQRAAELLAEQGVESVIGKTDGDGCGSCAPKLWLGVARDDVQAAVAVMEGDWRAGLDPHQIEALERAAHIVIDPDAAETTCPACLTTFATGPTECPDCGLRIG
ncbi:MAG: hypothetical protein HY899_00655 [Deltaproteobacteria bacterium]|nr:hypothetical protein [Deltaproteobacteria bacterium]